MIRFEDTRDAVLIARLNKPVQDLHVRLHPEYFKPYNEQAITKSIQELFEPGQALAIVALIDDQPAGYILYFLREQSENAFQYSLKTLHIDQMSVETAFLRQGVGTALLQQVLLKGQEAGARRIDLNTWATNESALQFFRKNGFHTFNERLQLVLED